MLPAVPHRTPRRTSAPSALPVLLLILLLVGLPAAAAARNLHLIEDLPNGFAIYRSGKPDREGVAEYRALGIQEIAVLSGNADDHELKYAEEHPALVVVYDEKQNPKRPPDPAFLDWFDAWVEEARREGRKIAFRCNCGCHRTGRLAAYYQMKWQNLTHEDAVILMNKHGRRMRFYPGLKDQVREFQARIRHQRTAAP
jgi:protein-tyrosine phosphatase